MHLLREVLYRLPLLFVTTLLHFYAFSPVGAFSTKYTNDMTISTPMQFEINGVRIENVLLVRKPNIIFITSTLSMTILTVVVHITGVKPRSPHTFLSHVQKNWRQEQALLPQ